MSAARALVQPLSPLTGVQALRAQLEQVVAAGRPAGAPCPSGVVGLDTVLRGGVPRGRITEVLGAMGAGKTALLTQVAARVLRAGGWVAWIDARRTLTPAALASLGGRLVVVRPRDPGRSAWSADLLLRSGVFTLVILDGAPPLTRSHGVRLAQLARDRDAACVVLHDDPRARVGHGMVRIRLTPGAGHRRRDGVARGFAVVVESGSARGTIRPIEVSSDIVACRLCTDSEIPDRRGVAPRPGSGEHTASPDRHPVSARPGEPVRSPVADGDIRELRTASVRGGEPPDSGTVRRLPIGPLSRGRQRAADPRYGRTGQRERVRERVRERARERAREPVSTGGGGGVPGAWTRGDATVGRERVRTGG